MRSKTIAGTALSGALAVGLGAFGAHGLQRLTADEKVIHGFQTGVQYQLYHTLALLAICALWDHVRPAGRSRSLACFTAGMLLFSGSLYLITALQVNGMPVPVVLRLLTPIGGLCLIAGWLMLAFAALSRREG